MADGARGGAGFALPMVLLWLCLLLTPLALLAAYSWEEAALARRMSLAARADHLAEYAFWEWMARQLARQEGYDPGVLRADSAPWSSAEAAGNWRGGSFRARASARRDLEDSDGDPATLLVTYSRASGFPDSPWASGGPVVLDVSAEGTVGGQRAALEVALTSTPYLPPEAAAVACPGPLDLSGPARLSGLDHDAAGAEAPGSPGVRAAAAAALARHGEVELVDGGPACPGLEEDLLGCPCRLLGLPPSSRYLERRAFASPGEPPWEGTTYLRGDYRGPVLGEGVLIVHNPLFDPRLHRASADHYDGVENPDWDPGYSHLDPARRPALLQPEGECSFRGLIVADDFRPGSGRLEVLGELLLLNPLGVSLGMDGGLAVDFSRETLRLQAHGATDRIITWVRRREGRGRVVR